MRMLDQIDSQKKPEKWKGPGKKLEIILRAEQVRSPRINREYIRINHSG